MSPTWARDPRALWRRCGDRVVVLVPDEDEPLVLTGSGTVTWDLLAEPVQDVQLASALAQVYAADTDVVASDLAPFLQEMADAGAVARM